MAAKSLVRILVATCALAAASTSLANAQNSNHLGVSNLPGAQTASEIMASASDGMSRYLAPNGPIQPAITALGGLPLRAGEMANNGITQISSSFNRGAQRLSRAAGQDGQIRMPGLDTAASMMPHSIENLGKSMQGMIKSKNDFIRGQAERGIQAANRMGEAMRQGLQVRSKGPNPLEAASQMMSRASDTISRGGQQIRSQLEQTLHGTMGRMEKMQGMGSDVGKQVQGYGQTLSKGAQKVVQSVQQTGEQLVSQLQQNHNKNMSQMTGMLGSLQNSVGQMGQSMQKNLSGLQKHAQDASSQISQSLQSAAQMPMSLIQSLRSSMMSKGGSSSSGGGGRY